VQLLLHRLLGHIRGKTVRNSIVLFACFYDSKLFYEQFKMPASSRGQNGVIRLCTAFA
jgi:hypothetical protein